MSRARLAAACAWLGVALTVGGLSGGALVAADLPLAATIALALLAGLVALLTAGAVLVALRIRSQPDPAGGCGACGTSCLGRQATVGSGSGSVANRACSSTS